MFTLMGYGLSALLTESQPSSSIPIASSMNGLKSICFVIHIYFCLSTLVLGFASGNRSVVIASVEQKWSTYVFVFFLQFAYNEMSFMLIRLLQSFSKITLDPQAQPPESRPPRDWSEATGRKAIEQFFPKSHLTIYSAVSFAFTFFFFITSRGLSYYLLHRVDCG